MHTEELKKIPLEEVMARAINMDEQFKILMAYYRCAIMEVETKMKVLNETLSLQYDRNPIETIKSRLKSPHSIVEKMIRKELTLSVENIERNLNDVAGYNRSGLKYVFDISDVHKARRIGRFPHLWEMQEAHEERVLDKLESIYGDTDKEAGFTDRIREIGRQYFLHGA